MDRKSLLEAALTVTYDLNLITRFAQMQSDQLCYVVVVLDDEDAGGVRLTF